MSRYDEDVAAAKLWENARVACGIAFAALVVVDRLFAQTWLRWPQALLALVMGVILVLEARALGRLGRSTTGYYIAAVLMPVAAYLLAP